MGKRHRQPPRRRRPLPASMRKEAAFWTALAVSLLAAAALYEAIGYRAEHVDHQYVSRYVPASAVVVSTAPSATATAFTNRPLPRPVRDDPSR
ncbi:hypothetical protein GS506_18640 [Rhodococcus hoagii]|nr:hypothetical protein [Prescottella equi]